MADLRGEETFRHREPSGPVARVRIGPLSLFALVIVVSLAVLAVLALSTAQASLAMSQRQANAVADKYVAEQAANVFVAEVDGGLARWRQGSTSADGTARAALETKALGTPAQAAEQSLKAACAAARKQKGCSSATASLEGNAVNAEFVTQGGQTLDITLLVQENGTYRVAAWVMGAVHNEEQPEGQLLLVE